MKKWILWVLIVAVLGINPGPAAAQDGPPILVGHITLVEGQLLRYVPEEQDWVATVPDAPFGLDDALYTSRNSRAEIRLPNRTLIRLNDRTQIQLIAVEEEFTELDLYSGTARFYHPGAGTLKVYTPFGYVLASSGSVFDLHSREKFMEVLALQGELEFRPAGMQARYRVTAGRPGLIADGKQVFTGGPGPEPSWQSWNAARDQAAARYRAYPGESARYLPPELDYEAPVLDENGRWEQVPYQGEVYYFWRPMQVVSGWAPFTFGRWTVWYDDPCWIPAEPFGYVTHHYGNWFFIGGYWYWAPPVRARVRPYPVPLLYIPWAWYPGRVAWIHHGTTIGWIPLAPHEPYYCRRYWGPRAVVVKDPRVVPVPISRYQHAHQAVTVHRDNFFAVNNYHPFRLTPLNRETIVRDFQPLPVLDRPFLTGADPLRRKHHFTSAIIREKPRPASVERIRLNQARFQEAERTRRGPEAVPAGQSPSRARPEPRPEARPPVTGPSETVRKRDLPDRFRTSPPVAPGGKEGPVPEVRPHTGPGEGRPDTRGRPEAPTVRPAIPEPQPRQRIETPAPRELPRDRGLGDNRPATRSRSETPPARPAVPEPQPRQRIETPAPPGLQRDRGPGDNRPAMRERPETSSAKPAVPAPQPRQRIEPPAPRELPRDRGPGDNRPATRGRPETPAPGPVIREAPVRERIERPEQTRDTGPGTDSDRKSGTRGKERSGEDGRGPKER